MPNEHLEFANIVLFLEKFLEGQDMRAEKIQNEVVEKAKEVWPEFDWDLALHHSRSEW